MEIEVGEYYRTESGYIDKIRNIDKQGNVFKDEKGKLQLWLGETIFGDPYSEEITKHSKNIIDLIEVGDFVNGWKILSITTNYDDNDNNIGFKLLGYDNLLYDIKIYSILTHEMYEQNCYKLLL